MAFSEHWVALSVSECDPPRLPSSPFMKVVHARLAESLPLLLIIRRTLSSPSTIYPLFMGTRIKAAHHVAAKGDGLNHRHCSHGLTQTNPSDRSEKPPACFRTLAATLLH